MLVPAVACMGMALVGVVMLASLLLAFLAPEVVISFWPWDLSVLTPRILGG